MQSPAALLALLVLAVGLGGGFITYTLFQDAQSADSEAPEDDSANLNARIVELEREVTALREAARDPEATPERRAVDPVSDARIEAAVAKYLAANPVDATATAKKDGKKNDLGQAFLHLTSDLSEKDYFAAWAELRESGQVEEMVKMFEKNATNNPSNPDSQVQLGVAYLMQIQGMTPGIETGKIATNADLTFDKALKLDPEHWDARFVKAQSLSFWPPMFGKQAEAIQHLETLRGQQETKSAQDVKYAQTYMVLGNLYSQQGKKDKAMEAWRKGATLFPDHTGLRDKAAGK